MKVTQMNKIRHIFLLITLSGLVLAQNEIGNIYDNYETYREKLITSKRIDHTLLSEILRVRTNSPNVELKIVGKSVEGRDINLIKIGSGKTKVLAWSQMHGDEPTATLALLDMMNFLLADDQQNELRRKVLEAVSFYFIPMLNPDGAEKFTRRNAVGVDLNRDAQRLQFPESRTLNNVRDSLNPEFGFNLHDQSQLHAAGRNNKPAVISFLAPPFNYERDLNEVREKSMRLIVSISKTLSKYIPDYLGRYSDEFEPRAFGDNFVIKGTSTVLIESGWWPNDREKNFVRKLNFISLLSALNSISDKSYHQNLLSDYHLIPENQKLMFDLLLRNITIEKNDKEFIIDIGINYTEVSDPECGFSLVGKIEDIGDLSTHSGYQEFECKGLKIAEGKIYNQTIKTLEDLTRIDYFELYQEGYIYVLADNVEILPKYPKFPINILSNSYIKPPETAIDNFANFAFLQGEDVVYVVINGFLVDLSNNTKSVFNGLTIP